MATVEKGAVTEEVVTTVEKPVVNLTLTPDEADTLQTILNYVGGDPNGRRGHASSIRFALESCGARVRRQDVKSDKSYQGLYFTDAD